LPIAVGRLGQAPQFRRQLLDGRSWFLAREPTRPAEDTRYGK